MGFWKFLPFLVLGLLVMYQAGMLQAAPFRSALENDFDPAILTEKEMCLLLAAMMNDYVQIKTSELKRETENLRLDGSRAKRYSNLSIYVLGIYTQDLNKVYIFYLTKTVVRMLERNQSWSEF
ncbi:hypothetical protein G4228_000787 [Cervus hanglu yarkandensis]|nr:hypothetical protein G4228_000787 [Cervus hanglu yarkandensis]